LNIPLIEDKKDLDIVPRLYRRALLNTLIELKPKNCLEFGSFRLESAAVFAYYFEKYQPEGKLITVDIALWERKYTELYNVHSVMVYPHSLDIESRHGEIQIYHPDWRKKITGTNSVVINGEIINKKMEDLSIDSFQFAFIDGDHSKSSFLSDLYITLPLIDKNGYILIDDIKDENHEICHYYRRELKPKYNFYEFEDWQPNPGMSLIKAEDLKL
jgi:predicted O-methyltransferase YrrM